MSEILLMRFNETIDQWIGWLEGYSYEKLCRKPRPESWSLGQMYVHIVDDTGYFVGQMREALESDLNQEKEMHADAKWMFDRGGFPDMLIEGPATNTSVPQPESKEDLLERLKRIKEDVNGFDFGSSKGKTRHPGLLYFSAPEWLQFAEMHMRHHFRQRVRIEGWLD